MFSVGKKIKRGHEGWTTVKIYGIFYQRKKHGWRRFWFSLQLRQVQCWQVDEVVAFNLSGAPQACGNKEKQDQLKQDRVDGPRGQHVLWGTTSPSLLTALSSSLWLLSLPAFLPTCSLKALTTSVSLSLASRICVRAESSSMVSLARRNRVGLIRSQRSYRNCSKRDGRELAVLKGMWQFEFSYILIILLWILKQNLTQNRRKWSFYWLLVSRGGQSPPVILWGTNLHIFTYLWQGFIDFVLVQQFPELAGVPLHLVQGRFPL